MSSRPVSEPTPLPGRSRSASIIHRLALGPVYTSDPGGRRQLSALQMRYDSKSRTLLFRSGVVSLRLSHSRSTSFSLAMRRIEGGGGAVATSQWMLLSFPSTPVDSPVKTSTSQSAFTQTQLSRGTLTKHLAGVGSLLAQLVSHRLTRKEAPASAVPHWGVSRPCTPVAGW